MPSTDDSLDFNSRATPPLAKPSIGTISPDSQDSDSIMSTPRNDEFAAAPLPHRPDIGGRKRSASIIVPRDSDAVEVEINVSDENDARCMSPRRNSKECEQLSRDAQKATEASIRHCMELQSRLQALADRTEAVKAEYEKLESENRFLQSYIGELMATSKITSKGAAKTK